MPGKRDQRRQNHHRATLLHGRLRAQRRAQVKVSHIARRHNVSRAAKKMSSFPFDAVLLSLESSGQKERRGRERKLLQEPPHHDINFWLVPRFIRSRESSIRSLSLNLRDGGRMVDVGTAASGGAV